MSYHDAAYDEFNEYCEELREENASLRARVAELEDALKYQDGYWVDMLSDVKHNRKCAQMRVAVVLEGK